ncbi:MAG: hypothetical protein JXC32_21905, partial [Anaerolineae bacterium]|nr:hypothetical protein [Anaerolineae bacterium]
HNSMLMVGAIDAAQKCADRLQDEPRARWLATLRKELTESLNVLWNPEARSYPDSIHEDGAISDSTSQHTSFLALLYDIIPETYAADALANLLEPPDDMVRVGSPFAMMTFYEALDKVGRHEEIIQSIIDAYTPMLAAGATTVWEVFPSSEDRPGGFPTRSHCHAWSSAPVLFLNRILLGIRPATPAGSLCEISPVLTGLRWAEGTVATAKGPVHVTYHIKDETLDLRVRAPQGMTVRYVENETHRDLKVRFTVEA